MRNKLVDTARDNLELAMKSYRITLKTNEEQVTLTSYEKLAKWVVEAQREPTSKTASNDNDFSKAIAILSQINDYRAGVWPGDNRPDLYHKSAVDIYRKVHTALTQARKLARKFPKHAK